jgi:hypothetical protein
MSIVELSRKVEIHFWDWAIPTLSASPFVRKCVRFSYRHMGKNIPLRRFFIGIGLSAFGFLNGMVAFLLVTR